MKPTDILHRAKKINPKPWEKEIWVSGYFSMHPIKRGGERVPFITDIETLNMYQVDPSTLCVWTTLTDKNGKKVFSGDVLYKKWVNGDGREEEVRHLIVFYDGAFCVEKYSVQRFNGERMEYPSRITQRWIDECQFEIIGSIHDNKELTSRAT